MEKVRVFQVFLMFSTQQDAARFVAEGFRKGAAVFVSRPEATDPDIQKLLGVSIGATDEAESHWVLHDAHSLMPFLIVSLSPPLTDKEGSAVTVDYLKAFERSLHFGRVSCQQSLQHNKYQFRKVAEILGTAQKKLGQIILDLAEAGEQYSISFVTK